jgi:hypothetical protein
MRIEVPKTHQGRIESDADCLSEYLRKKDSGRIQSDAAGAKLSVQICDGQGIIGRIESDADCSDKALRNKVSVPLLVRIESEAAGAKLLVQRCEGQGISAPARQDRI